MKRLLAALLIGMLAMVFVQNPAAQGVNSASAAAPKLTGPFNLYNVRLGKCIDVPRFGNGQSGGPINQFDCNYTFNDNQKWYMKQRPEDFHDKHPVFQFVNAKDGLCIDLPGTGRVPRTTKVIENRCLDGDNQYFIATHDGPSGSYYFRHLQDPELCLDVAGVATGGNDARLTLFDCSPNDDHAWLPRYSAPFTGTNTPTIGESCSTKKIVDQIPTITEKCIAHGIWRQPTPDGADDIDGRWVGRELASFSSLTSVCNWSIDFRYYGVGESLLRDDPGPVVRDCKRSGSREVGRFYLQGFTNPGIKAEILKACAELSKDGAVVLRQCHSIKP